MPTKARMDRLGIVAGVVLATGLLTGVLFAADAEWKAPARAARKPNPVPADDKSVAAGKELYAKHCLSCHGATGKGNGPAAKDLEKSPGDLSRSVMWEQTDGALFWKITEGRKPMPAYETLTTETERWNIINYVRTLAPKPASTTSKPSDGGNP